MANGGMSLVGSFPMVWIEHWNHQVEAPKGAPDLRDWPGPVESDFRVHSFAVIDWNVGDFNAENSTRAGRSR